MARFSSKLGAIAAALLFFSLPLAAQAARTDALWDYLQGGNYIQPNASANGVNLLLIGSNHYINFGVVTGVNGYGIRDNAGSIECKNSGGAWASCTGGTGGSGTVTSIDVSGGSTGLTTSGGPVTTSGVVTIAGLLNEVSGGTGSSTPLGGILVGNGTSAIKSLVIGSNLTFDGTTLSATGGGSGSGTVSTSTHETAGSLSYWTSNSGTPALLGQVATTSETCSSGVACTAHAVLTGGGAITLATIANGNVLGFVGSGSGVPTAQATSTLYGTAPAGGYVLGWNNTTNGIGWIATSTGGGGASTDFTYTTNYGIGAAATSSNALWGQLSLFASSTSATPALSASNTSGPAAVFGPGLVGISSTSPGFGLSVNNTDNLKTGYFYNPTPTTGKTQLTLRAGAGNLTTGTTDGVFQVLNSAGTLLMFVRADGVTGSQSFDTQDDSTAFLSQNNDSFSHPGLNFGMGSGLYWSGATQWWSGAKDLGLSRLAGGVLALGNGVANNIGGTFVASNLGLGTTSPFAQLAVIATSTTGVGAPRMLFAIASSTGGTATSTLFSVNNIGSTTIGLFGACSGTNALTTNAGGTIVCGAITGSGGGIADPFTHPAAGQSATTSLVLLYGQASTTMFSSYSSYFGATGTTTIGTNGFIAQGSSTPFWPLTIATTHALGGVGGPVAYFGDSVIANSAPLTYSYKSGSSAGASAVLGFNSFIDAGGTSRVINAISNGWQWKVDNRDFSGQNTASMSFHEIDMSGTDNTDLTITTAGAVSVPGQGMFGTTTANNYQLTSASTTAPQLALSAGAGVAQWFLRAEPGGGLSIGTTTVAGNATTTQDALSISGSGPPIFSVGSSSPFATVSIFTGGDYASHAASTLFAIGSSTAGTATSTLVLVNSAGQVGIGTTSPTNQLEVSGTGYIHSKTASVFPILQVVNDNSNASQDTIFAQDFTNFAYAGNVLHAKINNSSDTGRGLFVENAGTGTTTQLLNTGTGKSFEIDDQANDTSPFIIDAAGFVGIGTTSPIAALVSVAASTTAGTTANGYSGTVAIIAGFENTVVKLFQVIDQWGHRITGGDVPVLTSCGTSPSFVGAANDNAMTIQVGSVAATGCTATFAHAWPAAPTCTLSNRSMSVVNALTYTVSTTAIVLSQTGLTSAIIDIQCTGTQ